MNTSENSTDSATVTLFCGLNETDPLEFVLDSLNEQSRHIAIICGGDANLTDLTPDRDYVLYRRYMDQVLCKLRDFKIDTNIGGKLGL